MQMTAASLSWLAGTWRGELGDLTVEENWSEPAQGCMQARVRLADPNTPTTLELLAMQETGEKLALYVRQFTAALEPTNSQDFHYATGTDGHARFEADDAAGQIQALDYRRLPDKQLQIDVTLMTGDVMIATLQKVKP